ncbi:glycosyltransferase family 2 protein [Kitasatospora sp. NPDC088134]|uniref:glycosyltransferase family 2 protein n=1 Tax=Kitasatospora sp. NPDC088134 TaxID=3364071 RepID=UPI0038282A4E
MAPPLITVVLPAHDEQGQLKDCLDSLLGQSFREFEIIVVQTPSPHCSERLVEAYELRDARVRVLRLEEETGIGRARMAGAAHARGQYLLFLDADHLVAEDAFEAMAARLAETGELDVLLFGHNREHRGKLWPGGAAELLAAAGPAVFAAADRPELFGAPPLVWDRLLRAGTVPAFPDGFYEEVSAVHRTLLAAGRAAVLERECVTIRRRHTLHPAGSPGASHFDLLDRYESTFELLDAQPAEAEQVTAAVRPHLFTRMVRHYLFVLDLPGCLTRTERPQFFQRAAEHYRRFLPTGYRKPEGREGIKFSLLASNSYATFEVAKFSRLAGLGR